MNATSEFKSDQKAYDLQKTADAIYDAMKKNGYTWGNIWGRLHIPTVSRLVLFAQSTQSRIGCPKSPYLAFLPILRF